MSATTDKIQQLRQHLNFKARIKTSDERTFIGVLVCIDKQKNTILANTDEFRGGKAQEKETATRTLLSLHSFFYIDEQRFVGLVMIPGKHIVKVEAEDLSIDDLYT
ncbi:hypothetical protein BDF14DRAFT_1721753 [Spinellus fusiger]|nr:hypothetical protein BDF14DRAFT_1721753 [Spinellus fusiger]